MPSAIPGTFKALQTALAAALPGVTVVVGQEVGSSSRTADQALYIGGEGPDATGWVTAGTGTLKWAQLGGLFRDERFTVQMGAYASNGESDVSAAMTAAVDLYTAVGAYVVSDPTLGGAVISVTTPSPVFDLRFIQDDNGAAALLTFSLEWHARS